jgi:hypothetical protein
MQLEHLEGLDMFAYVDDFFLVQLELEQQFLIRRGLEAQAAFSWLRVDELDEHVTRVVLHLHDQQLAVVYPKVNSTIS